MQRQSSLLQYVVEKGGIRKGYILHMLDGFLDIFFEIFITSGREA